MTERHDLFEELDAFDPHWQKNYATLWRAAQSAGALKLYNDFVGTEEGKTLVQKMRDLRCDWTAANEAAKAQVEAERRMASRAEAERRAGVIIDWDRDAPVEGED